MVTTKKIKVKTAGNCDVVNITEQVSEAVRILMAHIEGRIDFINDAGNCLESSFGLTDVRLGVIGDEGVEMSMMCIPSLAAT